MPSGIDKPWLIWWRQSRAFMWAERSNIYTHRIHGAGIYANIGGILMGSMLPYIAYMDPMGYICIDLSNVHWKTRLVLQVKGSCNVLTSSLGLHVQHLLAAASMWWFKLLDMWSKLRETELLMMLPAYRLSKGHEHVPAKSAFSDWNRNSSDAYKLESWAVEKLFVSFCCFWGFCILSMILEKISIN